MFPRRKGDRTFIREDAAPWKESTTEDSRLWRELCSCCCACPSSTGWCPPEAPTTTTTTTSSTPSCRWVHRTARWAVGGFHLPGGLSHLVHLVDRSKGRQGRTTRLPQGGLVRYILLLSSRPTCCPRRGPTWPAGGRREWAREGFPMQR